MTIKKFAPALLAPLVLVLAACGGDTTEPRNDKAAASESVESSTPESPAPASASRSQFATDMQALGTALMSIEQTESANDAVDEATNIADTARTVANGAKAGVEGIDAAATEPLAAAATLTADKFDALADCGEQAEAGDTGACSPEVEEAVTALGELQAAMLDVSAALTPETTD